MPKIKYIITLDNDTDLSLNSAYSLIGAMSHILNKPETQNGKVVDGYGLTIKTRKYVEFFTGRAS